MKSKNKKPIAHLASINTELEKPDSISLQELIIGLWIRLGAQTSTKGKKKAIKIKQISRLVTNQQGKKQGKQESEHL